MSAAPQGFELELKSAGGSVRVPVPARAFAAAAEQLRWDALRAGQLGIEEWSDARVYVGPRWNGANGHTGELRVAITLVSRDKTLRRYHEAEQLQGLALFVQLGLGQARPEGADAVELHWAGSTNDGWGQAVPLAPLRQPLRELPPAWRPGQGLRPPTVLVHELAQRALDALGSESLRVEKELGGCLIGRLEDPDTRRIQELLEASNVGASAGHFTFDPRFWLALGERLDENPDLRLLGWVHTHLIDGGAPGSLSTRDLVTAHEHFRSPWSVAVLICASSTTPETRWFGWRDGGMEEIDAEAVRIASGP